MKFFAIVGNPPYQKKLGITDKTNTTLANQIYPFFITDTIRFSSKYVSLVTPSRWFTGVSQNKLFPKLRLFIKDHNFFKKIFHFKESFYLFDNITVQGGVNYYLIDKEFSGDVIFSNNDSNTTVIDTRPLFTKFSNEIITDSKKVNILTKIMTDTFIPLSSVVTGADPFTISGKKEVLEKISKETPFENSVELKCRMGRVRYIDKSLIKKNQKVFKSYKVFISKSAGDPSWDRTVIYKPYVAKPFDVCTESLITIGCFSTEIEAIHLTYYLKTKFLRYLVNILKTSQNVCNNVYQYVPLVDFTDKSSIKWSSDIPKLDSELYKYYKLSDSEIFLIESSIDDAKK